MKGENKFITVIEDLLSIETSNKMLIDSFKEI